MLTRIAAAAILVTAAVAVSACSAGPTPTPSIPTEAEYRAAVQATADCVAAAGFDVSTVEKSEASGEYRFGIDNAEPSAFEATYDQCANDHQNQIEQAYLGATRLSGQARDAAMHDLVKCLTDVGVSGLSEGTTDSRTFVKAIWDQLESDAERESQAMACMERYRGVWPPGDANNP